MTLIEIFRIMLLILLIICAVAVNLNKNLLQGVIIFMAYSLIMCVVWILLESPDLTITEAAVGAGISGTLFLMTLKKIRIEDAGEELDGTTGVIHPGEQDRKDREAIGHEAERMENKFFRWLDGDYDVMKNIMEGSLEPDENHEQVKGTVGQHIKR